MIRCTVCGYENKDGELHCQNPADCFTPLDPILEEVEDDGGPPLLPEDLAPAEGELPTGSDPEYGTPVHGDPAREGTVAEDADAKAVASDPGAEDSTGEPAPEEGDPALPEEPAAESAASEESAPAGSTGGAWPSDWCAICGADRKGDTCDACAEIPVEPTLVLEVEGFSRVRFRHREVKRIRVTLDSLLIGRTDPMQQLYPDIDLRVQHSEGKGLVSRRHAEICRRRPGGLKHYLICRTSNPETTHIRKGGESEARPLGAEEEVLLEKDDVFIIGEEVAFRVFSVEE